MKHVLIVVAHSDDETIGMAGTIRRHVEKGDIVKVVCMTDGVSARSNYADTEIVEREMAAERASKILGFGWLKKLSFADNAMDSYPLLEIVKAIELINENFKPDFVYTHSGADLNVDHRVVATAVLTAFRPKADQSCKEIRLMEIPSATDYGHQALTGNFTPNLYVNIENQWNAKLLALSAYESEIIEYPNSRSAQGIRNLAELRGNQVGYKLAEAFQVIRRLED